MPATAAARPASARAAAPARRATPRRRAAAPRRRRPQPLPGLVPLAVGRTAGAVGGLADSGLVVRLTRGRLWIGVLAGMLVGIVALNVLALSFSASSSDAARQADALKLQNSALRAELVERASSERIESAAAALGLAVPEPGEIRYVKPASGDAAEAARRLEAGELDGAIAYVPPATAPVASAVPVEPVAVAPVAAAPDPAATVPAEPVAEPVAAAPVAPVAPAPAAAVPGGGVASP